jgi:hypothetical protein
VAKIHDPPRVPADRPEYVDFDHRDGFFSRLLSMPLTNERIWIFAHNLGFDLRVVGWFDAVADGHFSLIPPPHMPGAGRYSSPLFVADGLPTLMRFFRADGQQFMLVDTMNWLDTSLRRIGEWLDFRKSSVDFREATDPELREYCRRDVDVTDFSLRRLWGWCQTQRWPDWSPTPAAQALQVYRMRYGRKRPIRPKDPEAVKIDREAYYGGLVDCFYVGRIDNPTYQVDCNGLYPAVMMDRPYPCELGRQKTSTRREKWRGQIDPRKCTAEVWIEDPVREWPVKWRDGTYWVRGKVRTILPGPELDAAIQRGVVKYLGRWNQYRTDDLFSGFVRDLWRQRKQAQRHGDGLIDHAAKRVLNSLHGKFGQRDGDWVYYGRTSLPGTFASGKMRGPLVKGPMDYRSLDGHTYLRATDQEQDDSFVPIASWCTSYARVYMDEIKGLIGPENIYYQGVDSLLINGDGLGRLQLLNNLDTGNLGHFKLEATYDWVDIQTINQIDTSHGGKHSGIKRGTAPIAPGVYEVEEWESLPQGLFSGDVSQVSIRRTYKRPPTLYNRRRIADTGITDPWVIDNWHLTPEECSSRRFGERDTRGSN